MLRWMDDKTHEDTIKNERVKGYLGICLYKIKIKRDDWHVMVNVMRRLPMTLIRRCLNTQLSRSIPLITWIKVVWKDLLGLLIVDL